MYELQAVWKTIRRRTAKSDIVEVARGLDGLYLSTHVVVLYCVAEVCDRRMCGIISTKNLLGFLHLVWLVHIVD